MRASVSRGTMVPVSRWAGAPLPRPMRIRPWNRAPRPLDDRCDQRPCQVAEDEEDGREEHGRPRLPAREVSELHGQHLGRSPSEGSRIDGDDLGAPPGLAGPPLARAGVDLVDLQVIGVSEVDDELGRIVGQPDDAVAVPGTSGNAARVCTSLKLRVIPWRSPQKGVLQPGRLLAAEPGQTHAELDEPRAVGEPGVHGSDPARRRALTERAPPRGRR